MMLMTVIQAFLRFCQYGMWWPLYTVLFLVNGIEMVKYSSNNNLRNDSIMATAAVTMMFNSGNNAYHNAPSSENSQQYIHFMNVNNHASSSNSNNIIGTNRGGGRTAHFSILTSTAGGTQRNTWSSNGGRLIRTRGDIILGGIFPMHEHNNNNPERPCGMVKEEKGILIKLF